MVLSTSTDLSYQNPLMCSTWSVIHTNMMAILSPIFPCTWTVLSLITKAGSNIIPWWVALLQLHLQYGQSMPTTSMTFMTVGWHAMAKLYVCSCEKYEKELLATNTKNAKKTLTLSTLGFNQLWAHHWIILSSPIYWFAQHHQLLTQMFWLSCPLSFLALEQPWPWLWHQAERNPNGVSKFFATASTVQLVNTKNFNDFSEPVLRMMCLTQWVIHINVVVVSSHFFPDTWTSLALTMMSGSRIIPQWVCLSLHVLSW